jgi:hypothetical protein
MKGAEVSGCEVLGDERRETERISFSKDTKATGALAYNWLWFMVTSPWFRF